MSETAELPESLKAPKGYCGYRRKYGCTVLILPSGALLPKGLEHVNHSPDGFEWGYWGSGPAQLAFAMLLHHSGPEIAQMYYQKFKLEVMAGITEKDWTIPSESITKWLETTIEAEDKKEKEELANPN